MIKERGRSVTKGKTAACLLCALALTVVFVGDACSTRRATEVETNSPAPSANATQTSANATTSVSASPTPQVTDAPVSWTDVARAYERVSDYVCVYEKEERAISNGEEQTIRLSFRKPFDVRMDWLDDNGKVDQTAVYRQDANDGKVIACKSGGLGSLMGTMRLDPNDSLALADSRHPVTEVGLGKIIERAERDSSDARINTRFAGEETLDGRAAYKFEFTATAGANVGGLANARKGFVWIDRELKLPVKLEFYDASGALIERHRFKDVRVNTKLGDKTFTL